MMFSPLIMASSSPFESSTTPSKYSQPQQVLKHIQQALPLHERISHYNHKTGDLTFRNCASYI
jgi:hypothetical protein